MARIGHRTAGLCGVFLALLSATACVNSEQSDSGMGSETNWLAQCDSDSECNAGSCLCGVCTVTCKSDSACGELGDEVECIESPALAACSEAPKHKLCGLEDTPFVADAVDTDAGLPKPQEDGGDKSPAVEKADGSAAAPETEPQVDDTVTETEAVTDGNEPSIDETDSSLEPTDPAPETSASTETEPAPPTTAGPTQADVLFVVDNSYGITDKRSPFADAAPKLVQQMYNPDCISATGEHQAMTAPSDACPDGYVRPFAPITDIHVGVITTSLGGYGAQSNCAAVEGAGGGQGVDMAHLLASLPRGASAAPSAADSGFFSLGAGAELSTFSDELSDLIYSAGNLGCGWEAPLEAWYRFLVEPFPYTKIVRQACNTSDTMLSCSGPELDGSTGNQLVDTDVLAQRAQFLRPNSLLTIVTMSDENDCSFNPSGFAWRLSQTQEDVEGGVVYYPAFKATDACNDPAYGPNSECCHSCGSATVPDGCPTATDDSDATVAAGCEDGRKFSIDDFGDHPNLRCFQQKRRFGIDTLLPVERYSTALSAESICPYATSLATADCSGPAVQNPLFDAEQPRPKNWIVFGSLVGAPWQDLAVSPDAEEALELRSTAAGAEDSVNWDWLIGDRNPASGIPAPSDPLMLESVAPRSGTNPATGEAVAAPNSGYQANAINGHEWNIIDESDLQFSCTFPLKQERTCLQPQDVDMLREQGAPVPDCTCTDYSDGSFQNPLCQSENGNYSRTQLHAGAYPGLRQLQLSYDLSGRSVVGSVCPKEVDDGSSDYGYRPFVRALLRRIGEVAGE